MVIECDWGWFFSGSGVGFFPHRAQTGPGGADGGQKSKNTQDRHNPHTKSKAVLQPYCKPQKKTGWEQNGEAKLRHPHNKRQILHGDLRLVLCTFNPIIPHYYTRYFNGMQGKEIHNLPNRILEKLTIDKIMQIYTNNLEKRSAQKGFSFAQKYCNI